MSAVAKTQWLVLMGLREVFLPGLEVGVGRVSLAARGFLPGTRTEMLKNQNLRALDEPLAQVWPTFWLFPTTTHTQQFVQRRHLNHQFPFPPYKTL